MMITKGMTWYMKYGFKPYDSNMNKPHDKLLHSINENNNILGRLIVSKGDIIRIAKEVIKENKLKINIKDIEMLSVKYPLFKDFIIQLSKKYNNYCCLIEYLLDKLYDRVGVKRKSILTDFYRKDFYLDI